jgi:hypothetical protein
MSSHRHHDRRAAHEYLAALNGGAAQRAPAPADPALPSAVCLLDAPAEEPAQWLATDFLLRAEPGLLVGEGGVMKSAVGAGEIAAKVAAGGRIFDRFPVAAPAPVLIVSGEDPLRIHLNRCEAIARGAGLSRERVLGNIHAIALQGADLASPRWRAHLAAEVARLRVGLVVLDPLADLASGDENDNSERRAVIATWRALTEPTGAAVMLVAHAGKGPADRPKRDRIRGASAIAAASRTTYFFELSDRGIGVECLKMSRAERPAPFVVKPTIQAAAANRGTWELARFDYVSVGEAALDAADRFVVTQLEGGVRLTTTDLKNAAKGTGVSGADIARALRALEMRRMIDFEPGEKNAKRWGLCLPGKLGNQGNVVAGQPASLPGNLFSDAVCLPAPYRGAGRQADRPEVGQPDNGVGAAGPPAPVSDSVPPSQDLGAHAGCTMEEW